MTSRTNALYNTLMQVGRLGMLEINEVSKYLLDMELPGVLIAPHNVHPATWTLAW